LTIKLIPAEVKNYYDGMKVILIHRDSSLGNQKKNYASDTIVLFFLTEIPQHNMITNENFRIFKAWISLYSLIKGLFASLSSISNPITASKDYFSLNDLQFDREIDTL